MGRPRRIRRQLGPQFRALARLTALVPACSDSDGNLDQAAGGSQNTVASDGSESESESESDASDPSDAAPASSEPESAEPESAEPDMSAGSEDSGSGPSDTATTSTGTGDADTEPIDCRSQLNIDPDFLLLKLSALSGEMPVMVDGQMVTIQDRRSGENRALARAYMRQEYEALGYDAWEEHDYGGINFIAHRRADSNSNQFLIIGAHYDSVANAPGADDDGGGVIQGLAIAHALRDCQLGHNLRILGFDQEETGLKG